MTERYLLLGKDVEQSPTPSMMNSAFDDLGIDARYTARSVSTEEFRREFPALQREGFEGFNITMPYKTEVVSLLDELDEVSTRVGAVNTVKREGSRFFGYNTDVDGILLPIRARGKSRPHRALLVGAGGAARAFCGAMAQLSCRWVRVAVRNPSRAIRFLNDMGSSFPEMTIESTPIDELEDERFDLVFNATPMGTPESPLPRSLESAIGPSATVFDAVYSPAETDLLRAARRKGSDVVRGGEMLLHGDVAAFRIMTGAEPRIEVMATALRAQLERAAV